MLKLIVPATELYDEQREEFIMLPEVQIELEHSLVSLSKWESKFRKPFLNSETKTKEETLEYIKCMTTTPEVPNGVFGRLTEQNIMDVQGYIDSKQTATTIHEEKTTPGVSETITSELIYYWMVSYKIPFECQHWHLERLLTLIRVCAVKNQPEKKLSRSEIASRNRKLNAERKAKYKTSG